MILISIIFFILIGLNVSPYLRGPGDWPPDWRWPYLFINTLDRLWLPLIVIFLIIGVAYILEKKKLVKSGSWILLVLLLVLGYLFQIAVLYFSRSGVSVLIHRVINPDLNGYFTEALKIRSLPAYLAAYNNNVLGFSMHATGHPPGAILFFWLIEKIIAIIPFLRNIASNVAPSHSDVLLIWNSLNLTERSTAIISAFIIPFLGSFNSIPLFLITKKLFNKKTAYRAVLLMIFLPALTLFTPLPDVFFAGFFLWSFYFFIKGFNEKEKRWFFLSGFIFSLGLFNSLSLLPLLLIYFFYLIKRSRFIFSFVLGFLFLYLILFLLKYNVFTVSYTLMTGLPKNRAYLPWIFYNLYDFFVFTGIPLAYIYFSMILNNIKDKLFFSFSLMLFILNFSGVVRGEVGRIWLPLMFPMLIISAGNLTKNKNLSTKGFLVILLLQAVQVLVLQEFWVTLW